MTYGFCHSVTSTATAPILRNFSDVARDQVEPAAQFSGTIPVLLGQRHPTEPSNLANHPDSIELHDEEELHKLKGTLVPVRLNASQICVPKYKAVSKSRFLTVLQVGDLTRDDI
jgi:hypothetical protein